MFYRPLPAVFFATLYEISGDHAFLYHLIQLVLHCLAAYLVFRLFRLFLPHFLAIILALVFLLHPINVESVANIAATTSSLSMIFVTSCFLLTVKRQLSPARLVGVGTLLLMGLLTKESAAIAIPAIIVYRYSRGLGNLRPLIFTFLAAVMSYLFLRLAVGQVDGATYSWVPIAQLSFLERLVNIPAILTYYFANLVLPIQLVTLQFWVVRSLDVVHFFIPLGIAIVLVGVLLHIGVIARKRETTGSHQNPKLFQSYLFFTVWTIAGLVPLLQLVPLDMTVADRWFYFPLVGILGLVGVACQLVASRWMNTRVRAAAIAFACIILLLLSIRTFTRAAEWNNELVLYGHDLLVDPNNTQLLDSMAVALLNENRPRDALSYALKSTVQSPGFLNQSHLGTVYYNLGQYKDAVRVYRKAISYAMNAESPSQRLGWVLEKTYIDLASAYLKENRPHDAVGLISKEALVKFPNSSTLYVFLALTAYQVGDQPTAVDAIIHARNLSKDTRIEQYYHTITNHPSLEQDYDIEQGVSSDSARNVTAPTASVSPSLRLFVSREMNISFTYPAFLRARQLQTNVVVLEEDNDSNNDVKYFVYATTYPGANKKQLYMPFKVVGRFVKETPLQVAGFQARMQLFTAAANDTHLLLLKRDDQLIAIRFPLSKVLDKKTKETMTTIIASINTSR